MEREAYGINRNIVECKVEDFKSSRGLRVVLIETLWNVKECSQIQQRQSRFCINRNIVECKVHIDSEGVATQGCINRNIVECKVSKRTCFSVF